MDKMFGKYGVGVFVNCIVVSVVMVDLYVIVSVKMNGSSISVCWIWFLCMIESNFVFY